jgi:hypothetical protein
MRRSSAKASIWGCMARRCTEPTPRPLTWAGWARQFAAAHRNWDRRSKPLRSSPAGAFLFQGELWLPGTPAKHRSYWQWEAHSSGRSLEFLEARPHGVERRFAAAPDRQAAPARYRLLIADAAGGLDRAQAAQQRVAIAAEPDHEAALMATLIPEELSIVPADRLAVIREIPRETAPRAAAMDRPSRLAPPDRAGRTRRHKIRRRG